MIGGVAFIEKPEGEPKRLRTSGSFRHRPDMSISTLLPHSLIMECVCRSR
jgi:hypothetical protein